MAEHHAVATVDDVEVGVPATEWIGLCQWLLADSGELGGEFLGGVNEHYQLSHTNSCDSTVTHILNLRHYRARRGGSFSDQYGMIFLKC